jgi:hypothetical protein
LKPATAFPRKANRPDDRSGLQPIQRAAFPRINCGLARNDTILKQTCHVGRLGFGATLRRVGLFQFISS